MCFFLMTRASLTFSLFFFNDTATTEIYTLSLHDALPIFACSGAPGRCRAHRDRAARAELPRSEEHTSELQSHLNLVCRLLLEKKKNLRICTCHAEPITARLVTLTRLELPSQRSKHGVASY